jgi:hypothetical protein
MIPVRARQIERSLGVRRPLLSAGRLAQNRKEPEQLIGAVGISSKPASRKVGPEEENLWKKYL